MNNQELESKVIPFQKFQHGDLVYVNDPRANVEAIVEYSYGERYGSTDTKSYSLYFRMQGGMAWFQENNLSLVKRNQQEQLQEWKKEIDIIFKQRSDLDWIFANGKEVLARMYVPSLQSLANCLNFGDIWGSRGEGVDLVNNSYFIISLAKDFLINGDKSGWLEACKKTLETNE